MTPRPVPELADPTLFLTPPWPAAAISLSIAPSDEDHPGRWIVRAEVPVPQCPRALRHVGHVELALIDLRRDAPRAAADAADWAPSFLARAVGHGDNTLVNELDDLVAAGPDLLLIVRRMYIEDAWRGCGLSGPLLTAALHHMQADRPARLAACRVEPRDIHARFPGLVPAEARYAALRTRRLLARAGFWPWRGVHIVDLQSPSHPRRLAHHTGGGPPARREASPVKPTPGWPGFPSRPATPDSVFRSTTGVPCGPA